MRFDANCEDILQPRSAKRTVPRGRRPTIESYDEYRSRSTTPKARTADAASVKSWNKGKTRSTTPNARVAGMSSRIFTRHDNNPEHTGDSSTISEEKRSSPIDPDKQHLDVAGASNEWDSWVPAMKKDKKKKSKKSVNENPNLQPDIVKIAEDSLDNRGESVLQ
ncbi:hypothetical protein MMC18_007807 [Xylographa bjoerkii]|nr:hypothetical protein [Xylographa bjoerkii]